MPRFPRGRNALCEILSPLLTVGAYWARAARCSSRPASPLGGHQPIQSRTGDDSWMDGGGGEEGGKADGEGGGLDNASTITGGRRYRWGSGLLSHGVAAEPEVGEAAAILPRARNTPARSSVRRTAGFGGSDGVGGGGNSGSALAGTPSMSPITLATNSC